MEKGQKQTERLNLAINYLEHIGMTNIKNTNITNEFNDIDLFADGSGYTYAVEVKHRYFDNDRFGDAMCEQNKVNAARRAIRDKKADKAVLMNIFENNIISTVDIATDAFHIYNDFKKCPHNTFYGKNFPSHKDETKEFSHFFQYNITAFTADTQDNIVKIAPIKRKNTEIVKKEQN